MTYLMLISGVFAIYWAGKSKNRLSKFSGYALGLSVIIGFVSYGNLDMYSPYAYGFFTLFAGFELTSSFKFKNTHKLIFGYAAIFSFLETISRDIVNLPFDISFELLLIPVPLLTWWLWKFHKRVVYQRINYMVVWSVQAVVAMYYSEAVRNFLSELF